jgi:hypothetical protein
MREQERLRLEKEATLRRFDAAVLIQRWARAWLARRQVRRLKKGGAYRNSYRDLKKHLMKFPHLQQSLYAAYASHSRAWESKVEANWCGPAPYIFLLAPSL